jgi:hypothetical protein
MLWQAGQNDGWNACVLMLGILSPLTVVIYFFLAGEMMYPTCFALPLHSSQRNFSSPTLAPPCPPSRNTKSSGIGVLTRTASC